ncbi:hypothetical protein BG011_007500 [Mortierella polycephala]|uniref:Uncharacterized protein n=1 Tax=Mortierella polycephala TaxID=41804 RepID=A0A9P6TYJ4_9FUNG|nr:hypothetical protein BG011_007500 [Mortierella polycephala]
MPTGTVSEERDGGINSARATDHSTYYTQAIQTAAPVKSTHQRNAFNSAEANPSVFKDHSPPSTTNDMTSNATTEWTIGHQKDNKRLSAVPSASSSAQSHEALTTATPPLTAAITTTSRSSTGRSEGSNFDPLSARSRFLRVFSKFKSKHSAQTRPNANLSGTVSEESNSHTNNDQTASISTSSSFVPSHIRLHQATAINSVDHSSAHSRPDTASVSMASLVLPKKSAENEGQLQDIDMEVSDTRRVHPNEDRSAAPSLRAKLKSRVHNTLASIKSSSNLREKARLPEAASSSPSSSPKDQVQVQGHQSSSVSDSPPSASKNRQSKAFWTFPRVRPESSSQSTQMPWETSNRPHSMADQTALKIQTQALDTYDTAMLSPETRPADEGQQQSFARNSANEVDSDDSIDIIMPSDYGDYTQFAELPLKKRKKLEAAAAAAAATAASDARPNSKRSNKEAIKRLLPHQKAAGDKVKDTRNSNIKGPQSQHPVADDVNPSIPTQQPRNSRKRPKDQDSIEQNQRQEPNKMFKRNSADLPEWRKAFLRSIHFGRGNQTAQMSNNSSATAKSSGPSQVDQTGIQESSQPALQGDGAESLNNQGPRPKRSDSVQSVRSRSMATSTHPGLLATTIAKPRVPGTNRETLEMAMRRRRRSSAVRSGFLDLETPHMIPDMPAYMDDDNVSTTNITHTFTSFTLELADMSHAHAVVNNSAVPGLFNFKRQSRLTISSGHAMDTDHEFKCFDSDGDAISGYTGDADVSMEEVFVRPRTPVAPKTIEGREGKDKGKTRESGGADILTRRRMSNVEGDSDTVPELPTLTIRTRDLNRSSGGNRCNAGLSRTIEATKSRESPRSPRRAGSSSSPTLTRKPSWNLLSSSPTTSGAFPATKGSPTLIRSANGPPSMEEVVSWEPRNVLQPVRPTVPSLNTKPLPITKGSGLSSSTTLLPSSCTPDSATSTILTESPGAATKNEVFHFHQRQPSSSHHSQASQHHQQASSDTLLPNHLKNFSTASTLSASSGYSAQTLTGNTSLTTQPVEFDPDQDFPPTTPVDLKAMDFDTLLRTAEQEQFKGREEPTLKKKKSFHSLKVHRPTSSNQYSNISPANGVAKNMGDFGARPLNAKSGLSALVMSASNVDEPRARDQGGDKSSHTSYRNNSKPSGLRAQGHQSGQHHQTTYGFPRVPASKSAVAFDVNEYAAGATGAARNNPRSKRVMKKKMSVIKLSGNVQGRREDDGMIRVSATSPGEPRQWRAS